MEQVGGTGRELPPALLGVLVLALARAVPSGEERCEVRCLVFGCWACLLASQAPAVSESGDDRRRAPVSQLVTVFDAQELRGTLLFQGLGSGDIRILGEGHHGPDQVAWIVVTEFGGRQRLPATVDSSPQEGVLVGDVELVQVRDPHDLSREILQPWVPHQTGRHVGGCFILGRIWVGYHEQGAGLCLPGAGRGMDDGLAQPAGRCVRHLGREGLQFVVDGGRIPPGQDPAQNAHRFEGLVGVLAGQNGGQGTGAVVVSQQGHHPALTGRALTQEIDRPGHGQR